MVNNALAPLNKAAVEVLKQQIGRNLAFVFWRPTLMHQG